MILASGSRARRELLAAAGLDFRVLPAAIDERAIRLAAAEATGPGYTPRDAALTLAEAKAVAVAAEHPGTLVIGSDQVLDLDGRIFEKPRDLDEAGHHLRLLRGREHRLHSAAALARDGRPAWRHVEMARLTMKALSDDDIRRYLADVGARMLGSVGVYEIENPVHQLFERVEGERATIMGLPLAALLGELRRLGVLGPASAPTTDGT